MPIDSTQLLLLFFLFFGIALLYSSVGFGGGSSYLAILSVFLVDFHLIRTHALICNLVVVSVGSWIAYKNKLLSFKKVLPYSWLSIPASFLGATMKLSEDTFFFILGATLLASSIMMLVQSRTYSEEQAPKQGFLMKASVLGGAVGFLSGLVGIGGGIFLSPIINLLKWENPKKVAAIASFFILINSISGLIGLWVSDKFQVSFLLSGCLVVAVFLGGTMGSFISANKLNILTAKRLTALLIMFIGLRTIYNHL